MAKEKPEKNKLTNNRFIKNLYENRYDELKGIFYVVISMLAVYCVIWAFTSLSPFSMSTYNSYVLQAKRWLSGCLDLGRDYSYLEIAEYGGKYYISFPPIPSVLLLPFCLIFENVPDNFVITVMGIIGGVYAYKMVYYMRGDNKTAVFFALFATIGSNFLHVAENAGVWYMAQTCSFTFTMIALYYAATTKIKSGWAPLFFLSLAFGCRPMQIVYLPLIVWLMYDNKLKKNDIGILEALKKYWWWVIPPLVVGIFLMTLNYLRFDNPFEFGHNYLPEFKEGVGEAQFSSKYLLTNIKRMLDIPEVEDGIVQFPRFNGCAFWLISPIFLAFLCCFIYGIKKNYKTPELWIVVALFVLHMIVICMHRTLGGSQFGNRYTVDMIPTILFGIAVMLKTQKKDLLWLFTPMFFWGLGINLVGTVGYFLGWYV